MPESKKPTTPEERRAFIRHPTDVPIRVERVDGEPCPRIADVSYGGLSFISDHGWAIGTAVNIRIDEIAPGLDAPACVVWCQREGDGFHVGVRFRDPEDAFRSRLVEQLTAIERIRREIGEREGREVSRNEAAQYWVLHHAAEFPDP